VRVVSHLSADIRECYGLILAILIVFSLAACSASQPRVQDQSERVGSITPAQAPFEVFIDDEFYDGTHLTVAFTVRSASSVGQNLFDQGLVLLRSMDGDLTVDQANFSFSDQSLLELQRSGSASAQTQRVLQVRSNGAHDYQVEVLWGGDAQRVLEQLETQQVRLEGLSIDPLGLPCQAVPCELTFRVEGVLMNSSPHLVDSITLGVKYLAPEELTNLELEFAEDELLFLEGLSLAPGQSQPLRVILEEPLAIERFDRGVRPAVQITDFRRRERA